MNKRLLEENKSCSDNEIHRLGGRMKSFVLSVSLFLSSLSAQAQVSADQLFKSFNAVLDPSSAVVRIDWSNPLNAGAKTYKTTFEMALQDWHAQKNTRPLLAGKFIVVTPGCGSECQLIGILNIETGVARLAKQTASYGVEYTSNSRLLVVNPKNQWPDHYKESKPSWLQVQYYVISDSGEISKVFLHHMIGE